MDVLMDERSLTQPLPDLAAWTAYFRDAEIPVLARSADAVEDMRLIEDEVDANLIGETVAADPHCPSRSGQAARPGLVRRRHCRRPLRWS